MSVETSEPTYWGDPPEGGGWLILGIRIAIVGVFWRNGCTFNSYLARTKFRVGGKGRQSIYVLGKKVVGKHSYISTVLFGLRKADKMLYNYVNRTSSRFGVSHLRICMYISGPSTCKQMKRANAIWLVYIHTERKTAICMHA